jgi:hypothetical protein
LHIVIVVNESSIPQLIIDWKYLGIVELMNWFFIVIIDEHCFKNLEILLVHLSLV